MFAAALIAGFVCVAIWVYLLAAHGQFWRIPLLPALAKRGLERGTQAIPDVILSGAAADFAAAESTHLSGRKNATVAVVIPARNEADAIGRAVRSLLRQTGYVSPTLLQKDGEEDGAPYFRAESLHIFVVDDNSTDRTADVARQAAQEHPDRVTIVCGRPLPPGWSGKLWAVQQGVEQALALNPDYLLLTDADIEHDSHNVGSLIGIAESGGYDIASYMVKLHCRSLAEKLLIPAFVFFFFMLYPPEWIRDPRRKTAGAAGGCILIRPAALERIGGIASIRNEIIDDCALARAVKENRRQGLAGRDGGHPQCQTLRIVGRNRENDRPHRIQSTATFVLAACRDGSGDGADLCLAVGVDCQRIMEAGDRRGPCIGIDVRGVLADGAVLRVEPRVGFDATVQRGVLFRCDNSFRSEILARTRR